MYKHTPSFRPGLVKARQDLARQDAVLVRRICCDLMAAGMRHAQIAEALGVPIRTLSSWKTGTTVPHWAVRALERLAEERAA